MYPVEPAGRSAVCLVEVDDRRFVEQRARGIEERLRCICRLGDHLGERPE